jgi:hypothetical protein
MKRENISVCSCFDMLEISVFYPMNEQIILCFPAVNVVDMFLKYMHSLFSHDFLLLSQRYAYARENEGELPINLIRCKGAETKPHQH